MLQLPTARSQPCNCSCPTFWGLHALLELLLVKGVSALVQTATRNKKQQLEKKIEQENAKSRRAAAPLGKGRESFVWGVRYLGTWCSELNYSSLPAFCCAPAELAVPFHPRNPLLLTPKVPVGAFPLASLFWGNFQSIKPRHSPRFWDSPAQSLASFFKALPRACCKPHCALPVPSASPAAAAPASKSSVSLTATLPRRNHLGPDYSSCAFASDLLHAL